MKKFKNQAEMMQALLDGEKIQYGDNPESKAYHYMKDSVIYTNELSPSSPSLGLFANFHIYELPKKKKKIKLYRYYIDKLESIHTQNWSSTKYNGIYKVVKTETKEIEVDE